MAAIPREPVTYPPAGHTLPVVTTSRFPRSVKTVTEDGVHWTPDPVIRGFVAGPGFFRLTGPDGDPGDAKAGAINIWQTVIDPGTGKPDLTNIVRTDSEGVNMTPGHGDWIITNENGDVRIWLVGPGGTFTVPIDLPDGPQGPPGPDTTASGKHVHELVAKVTPTYANVRDNYAGAKFVVGSATAVTL